MTQLSATHTHSGNPVLRSGASLERAAGLVIILHGRGGNAANSISLADALSPEDGDPARLAWAAPQATLNVWYPFPFTAPVAQNEPALSSALTRIDEVIDEAIAAGVPVDRIALGGFSQGACLTLEYAARGTRKLAYAFGLAGALIGDPKAPRLPLPDVAGLPIYMGVGTADPLIGLDLVIRSVNLLRGAGAKVTFEDFPGVDHTITTEEILAVRGGLAALLA